MTRSTSPSPPRPRPPSGFVAPKGPGTLYLQVVATDSLGAATTGTVTVNVLANQPPVITNGASQTINNIKVNQAAVQLNGTATDPDNAAPSANQTVSYSWSQVDGLGAPLTLLDPDTVALSSQTAANPTFTAPDHPATLHFKVVVSDSYDTTVGTVTVNVVGSLAPTANAGPDQTVGHQVVTLDGSGSTDPDVGETATLTYAWTQVDGLGAPLDSGDPLHVTLSSATAKQPTFTAPVVAAPSVLHFSLVVTDASTAHLSSPPDTVDITVNPSGAPTANAGAPQTNKATNSVVTLNGNLSTDPDIGETATLYLRVDAGRPGHQPAARSRPDPRPAVRHDGREPDLHLAALRGVDDAEVPAGRHRRGLLSSAPAFTTVQINANRARPPSAPSTITPAAALAHDRSTVTLSVPRPRRNDADGDPFGGFTYQWIQTASAAATTPCAPSCPVANVTPHPDGRHERPDGHVYDAGVPASGASLFFRMNVGDGFGATIAVGEPDLRADQQPPDRAVRRRGPTECRRRTASERHQTANRVYIGQWSPLTRRRTRPGTTQTARPRRRHRLHLRVEPVDHLQGGSTQCTSNCIFGGTTRPFDAGPAGLHDPAGHRPGLHAADRDRPGWRAGTVINFALNQLANTAPTVTATGVRRSSTSIQRASASRYSAPHADTNPTQTLTYQWTQVDGSGNPLPGADPLSVTINNPTTLTPTFTAPATPGSSTTRRYARCSARSTTSWTSWRRCRGR